jgi:hypothetical protein
MRNNKLAEYLDRNKYYYLDERGRLKYKGVRIVTLRRDLNRGVKFLNEKAYHISYGATRSSIRFFAYLSSQIDVTNVYRAKLTLSQRHWFTLRLWTTDGYLIMLKGVSGGYFGEGTRGCYDILKACGFNERQCWKAFKEEQFEVRKYLTK